VAGALFRERKAPKKIPKPRLDAKKQ
jgi:hypothetical protein